MISPTRHARIERGEGILEHHLDLGAAALAAPGVEPGAVDLAAVAKQHAAAALARSAAACSGRASSCRSRSRRRGRGSRRAQISKLTSSTAFTRRAPARQPLIERESLAEASDLDERGPHQRPSPWLPAARPPLAPAGSSTMPGRHLGQQRRRPTQSPATASGSADGRRSRRSTAIAGGTWPRIGCSGSRACGRAAASSAAARGYRDGAGVAKSCVDRPLSTTRPSYITATRSAISATTPRSWVMSITAMPSSRLSSLISSRICAWVVTSSAVVGSSAISSSGSQAERHGDHGALAHAAAETDADSSSRLCRGRGMPTCSSISTAAPAPRPGRRRGAGASPRRSGCRSCSTGLEAGHRLLEDHRDLARRGSRASSARADPARRDPRPAPARRRVPEQDPPAD